MELEHAIGVIDIGSNSFHMVVGGYHNKDYFKILDDIKVNVRLCEGLAETGYMSEERMQYGEDTLILFKELCESYHLKNIIIVATAAVRKAKNGPDFVKRIKEKVGLDIDVISGHQEAEFDYLGSINSINFKDAITMDIGGGSAQFCLVRDRKLINSISLPFGSIDLMELFDLGDHVSRSKLKELRKFLKEAYDKVDFLKEGKHLPVIGIGGTIRSIGKVHRELINYPLELAHDYKMSLEEVDHVIDEAINLDYKERKKLPGMPKGRVDIFPGASYALKYLMEYIESDQLIISDAGIRNGIIYNYFGYGPDNLVDNIFDTSLINTMLLYDCNFAHSYHLLGIANKIADQLKPYSHIKQDFSKILKAGTMLHDMGIYIQFRNHHEHSFYLILNAGLEGIEQKEILLAAFVALNHRIKKKVRISDLYLGLLTEEDQDLIDELSLYVQMSEYLDRTMDGVVRDLWFDMTDDKAILNVVTVHHPVMVEMIVEECKKKFKRVFGRDLEVHSIVVDQDAPEAENKIREDNPF